MAKANEVKDGDIMSNIIVLRNVWGKAGQHTIIQPLKNSKGLLPDCVRQVDPATGKMILLEGDKANTKFFNSLIPENREIEIFDGKVFNLDDPLQANEWECIKNCKAIAPSRDAKDENGRFLIDGTSDYHMRDNFGATARYGSAEYYIERPGLAAKKRLTRQKLILKAKNYIVNDDHGLEGWLRMAKVLGRNMQNQPVADVEDFLFSVADKTPEKIIDLYEGGDLHLRFLLISAKEKNVITKTGTVWFYGDTALGGSDDAVIEWMRNPKNKKTFDIIKKDTYADMFETEKAE